MVDVKKQLEIVFSEDTSNSSVLKITMEHFKFSS